jgi:hypothetical protein
MTKHFVKFAFCSVLFVGILEARSIEAAEGGHGCCHAGIFAGVTSADSHSYPTFGLEFEYAAFSDIGLLVALERITGDHEANVGVLGLNFHTMGNGRVLLGAGVESSHGHSENLVRLGFGWAIPIGKYSATPSLAIDRLGNEHTALVAGVSFGLGF